MQVIGVIAVFSALATKFDTAGIELSRDACNHAPLPDAYVIWPHAYFFLSSFAYYLLHNLLPPYHSYLKSKQILGFQAFSHAIEVQRRSAFRETQGRG